MRIVIAASLAALATLGSVRAEAADYRRGDTIVGRAIAADGDTLLLDRRLRVRLHGISAPEMTDWPAGAHARAVLDEILGGLGEVTCAVVDVDNHKRPVARCETAAGIDLAEAVVRAGHATVWRTFVYGAELPAQLHPLDRAEVEARRERRGLWADYQP